MELQLLATAEIDLTASVQSLTAERDRLVPQLEQARWQNRQLEKKLEDANTATAVAQKVGWICMGDEVDCHSAVKILMHRSSYAQLNRN